MSHEPVSLTPEQLAAVRTGAASVPSCWRERYLNSVLDELLGHEPDRVSDEDVPRAIDAVRNVFHALNFDDD
jgi:hypothetical protein